jgi:hypothetical protein
MNQSIIRACLSTCYAPHVPIYHQLYPSPYITLCEIISYLLCSYFYPIRPTAIYHTPMSLLHPLKLFIMANRSATPREMIHHPACSYIYPKPLELIRSRPLSYPYATPPLTTHNPAPSSNYRISDSSLSAFLYFMLHPVNRFITVNPVATSPSSLIIHRVRTFMLHPRH